MSKNIKACLTSNTDNWKTPSKIYKKFIKAGYIDCFKYKSKQDELKNNYKNKRLFINPPFSKMKEVAKWVIKQAENNIIALLIPARTNTKYFHDLLELTPTIYFIKGRLKYSDTKSAPFPTILMIFEPKVARLPLYLGIEQDRL